MSCHIEHNGVIGSQDGGNIKKIKYLYGHASLKKICKGREGEREGHEGDATCIAGRSLALTCFAWTRGLMNVTLL